MSIFKPSVDELVRADHAYRKFLELLDFDKLCVPLADIRQRFATILLQWIEDLSDST